MSKRKNILARFDLAGRSAVITGGSKGLGKSMAMALSEAGASVLIAARREAELKATAEEIASISGNPVEYCCVDLSDRQSTKQFAIEAEKILGGVDIFVANAAMEMNEPLEKIQDDSLDKVVETNFNSSVILTREFSKAMKQRGWGRILYISSATAVVSSNDGHSVYSSTKAALHSFARTAAVELGGYGVNVNVIAAGTYYTEMTDHALSALPPEGKEAAIKMWGNMNALGRWGKEEEMEGTALLLCSDAGSYITGAVFSVDGGLSIRMTPNFPVE